LASFKRLVTERFNEIKGSQLKEFKDELKRISHLEQSTEATARTHEERLDSLSEAFSSIQAMPSEISVLREKIGSIEELSGSLVKTRDFSQRLRELGSSVEQLQQGLSSLDKRLHSQSAGLESAIEEALGEEKLLKKAQDGMNKLIESRITDVESKLSSSIEELARGLLEKTGMVSHLKERLSEISRFTKLAADNEASLDSLKERVSNLELSSKETGQKANEIDGIIKRLTRLESLSKTITDNSDLLDNLGEEYSSLRSLTSTLPSTLEKHSDAINKILESKDFLADSVASMKSDIKGLSDRASSFQERIVNLEKGFAANARSKETRLDELSETVSSMDSKLEASRSEIKEFREYVIQHVNDIINSYEKRFGELSKNLSARHSGGREKSLTEIVHLKDKVAELDSMTKNLSAKAVPETEFVETIKSISKRIDDIEELYSNIDKKTSVHEAQLDAAVQKALSDDRFLKAGQKHMQELLDTSIADIEKRLSESVSNQTSKLSKNLEEISSIREEMGRLKVLEQHLDSDVMSRVGESLGSFTQVKQAIERKVESLSKELQSMNDKLIEQKGSSSAMEQRFKSALDKQQATIREMFSKQRASLDGEISEETAKALKDAEIGELKRKQEFEKLLRSFQEMHIKTQQNLDDIAKQKESFLQLERGLREKVEKATTTAQSKLSADQDKLRKRLDDSESLIMKLNNMVSELQVRLEKEKNVGIDIDKAVSEVKEELVDRMKTNEEMFDTEMDAFRRSLENITNNIVPTSELKDLNKRFQELYAKTQSNIDMLSGHAQRFEQTESKLKDKIETHTSEASSKLAEDYERLSNRLIESEKMVGNLSNMISDLQLKLDSKTDVKLGLDNALTDLKSQVDNRMKTMDKMITEFNTWKDAHKGRLQELPKSERKQLDQISKSIGDLSNRLETSRDEMKNFKEYVIEYMNNLVNTYEGRMRSLKGDIENKIVSKD
jgi:chromosome segregation ATPase